MGLASVSNRDTPWIPTREGAVFTENAYGAECPPSACSMPRREVMPASDAFRRPSVVAAHTGPHAPGLMQLLSFGARRIERDARVRQGPAFLVQCEPLGLKAHPRVADYTYVRLILNETSLMRVDHSPAHFRPLNRIGENAIGEANADKDDDRQKAWQRIRCGSVPDGFKRRADLLQGI